MSKLRVYELAKELGVDTKRVMDALRQLGQDPKNHMSTVEGDDAARVTQMVRSPSGRDDAAKASAQTPREAPERRAPDSEVVEVAKPPSAGARPAAPRGKAELPPGMLAPAGFERQFNKVDLRLRDKVRGRASVPPGAALSGFGGVPGRAALPGNLRGGDARVLIGGVPRVEREERARPARPTDARPGGRFLFAPEEPAEEEKLPSEAAVEPGERTGAAEGLTRQEPLAAAPPSEVKAAEARATAARPSAAEARPAAAHPSVATPPAARVAEPKPAELGAGEAARGAAARVGAEVRRESAVRADYLPPATPGEEVPRPAPSRPAVGPGLGPDPSLRPSAQLRRLQAQTGPGAALQPAPRREFAGPSPARPVRSVEGDIGLPVRRHPGARAPLAGPRPGGAPALGPRPAGAPRPAGPGRPGAPVRPAPAGRGRGRGGRLFVPPPPPEVVPEKQDRRTGGGVQRGDRRRAAVEAGERLREEVRSGQRGDLRRPLRRSSQPVTVRSNRPVVLDGPVQVKELASRMQMTAAEVLRKLIELGVFVTINQELDPETAAIVCQEFGFQVEVKPVETEDVWNEIEDPEEPEEVKKPRPPVVVVMGHVDHGKTSLLDAIRETRVAAGEAGGITQHIGAYTVQVGERMVTFLDTPGHEAFTAMRARGAKVTDVAVLVVAADDGVMPQTVEAIRHAREADVPMVVAINKIDKPGADPEHVKQALTEHGLVSEEWGGETIMVPVSAKQRTNLTQLLEMILLVADVRELRANPDKPARGTVIEAQLDRGRGAVATVLVQAGTLHPGDAFVCGRTYGRVRAMIDDSGKRIKKAGPSVPVVVLGFGDLPEAGDVFRVVEDEKQARSIAERRSASARREMQATAGRVTLDELSERIREGEMKDLVLIVKADVQGSVEALVSSLEKIHNEEARVRVIHSAAGAISESDVMLAAASGAIIIGFNVRPDPNAQRAAERESVDIRLYRVIYDAVDDVEKAIKGLLKPKFREQQLGRAEVRAIFRISRVGTIAGCYVLEGKITKQAQVRVVRDGTVVYEGRLASLKHLKDDVREVAQGFECGMGFENWNDVKEGDVVEAFVVEQVAPEG